MIALYLLIDLWLFFLMYVGSMAMIRAKAENKLNVWLWVLCLPFILISLIMDFLNNVFVFSVIYLEIPKEMTVTSRLKRHAKQQTFRGKLSRWVAETFLNPFDHTENHID